MSLSFEDWWDTQGRQLNAAGGPKALMRAAWGAALAQQARPETGGPDYRCVMCDKPIAVACKDCTEYAYDAVGYPKSHVCSCGNPGCDIR